MPLKIFQQLHYCPSLDSVPAPIVDHVREVADAYACSSTCRSICGDGKTVASDGTQYDFYGNSLLAGYRFRYEKMGAVAYRHVTDNYIAVVQHFTPPGVWEAIYVIEGLLKAGLSVKTDTAHANTQGQSAAVFAFTYLFGINLMLGPVHILTCGPKAQASTAKAR